MSPQDHEMGDRPAAAWLPLALAVVAMVLAMAWIVVPNRTVTTPGEGMADIATIAPASTEPPPVAARAAVAR